SGRSPGGANPTTWAHRDEASRSPDPDLRGIRLELQATLRPAHASTDPAFADRRDGDQVTVIFNVSRATRFISDLAKALLGSFRRASISPMMWSASRHAVWASPRVSAVGSPSE